MAIIKSTGVTDTERMLADYCERSFLGLWSWPNLYEDDGKELSDVLAVFEDRVFIFFDREGRHFDKEGVDTETAWSRWRRKVVDAQIDTARGAERYLRSGRPIFLDAKLTTRFPLDIRRDRMTVHKIIVAHGAAEACKAASAENISGALAISYGEPATGFTFPFVIGLDKTDPVHVLDSHTLPILFGELDTVADFAWYLDAKLEAIQALRFLVYSGEEDLLALCYRQFDEAASRHYIRPKDTSLNGMMVGEGEWVELIKRKEYQAKKKADEISYQWDGLIQTTAKNALSGKLITEADIMKRRSAIHEMAMEPRVFRRALSQRFAESVATFPDIPGRISRKVSFVPSFYPKKGYVLLQLRDRDLKDYENDYRPKRRALLQIACGALKNVMPELETIVGIAIEPPKYAREVSEDLLFLDCRSWPAKVRAEFEEANKNLKFFADWRDTCIRSPGSRARFA
jgi:hypothetical protein